MKASLVAGTTEVIPWEDMEGIANGDLGLKRALGLYTLVVEGARARPPVSFSDISWALERPVHDILYGGAAAARHPGEPLAA